MTTPVRLQLSRSKGFRLHALSLATNGLEVVNVARPFKYGNPFTIAFCRAWFDVGPKEARAKAVELHAKWLDGELGNTWTSKIPPTPAEIIADLAGRNVACVCGLEVKCHGDTLLERANR